MPHHCFHCIPVNSCSAIGVSLLPVSVLRHQNAQLTLKHKHHQRNSGLKDVTFKTWATVVQKPNTSLKTGYWSMSLHGGCLKFCHTDQDTSLQWTVARNYKKHALKFMNSFQKNILQTWVNRKNEANRHLYYNQKSYFHKHWTEKT